jgi:transcription-repair coupling factor (superfamily II helicase)
MDIKYFVELYANSAKSQQIADNFQLSQSRTHLQGLIGSQQAFVAAGVYWAAPQPHLFILENKEEAAYFENDLKTLLPKKDVLFFADSFKKPGNLDEINKANVLLRAETVARLLASHTSGELVVTYPEALFEKVVNANALEKNTLHIAVNEQFDTHWATELLTTYGFVYADFVYEPGQFSVRGGIIDIYSFGNDLPYRIELLGKDVDSIRVFDPLSQLSVKKVQQVTIIPNIQTQFESRQKTSLFEIIPENAAIWVKNLEGLLDITQKCYEKALFAAELLRREKTIDEDHEFVKDNNTFINAEDLLRDLLPHNIIEFGTTQYFKQGTVYKFNASPQPLFNKNFDLLTKDLKANQDSDIINYLFAGSERQAKRLIGIFDDLKPKFQYITLNEAIQNGFIDRELNIACYTDHQIFERYHKFHIKQGYSKDKALTVKLLRDLQPGDYVTHLDHGVGIYTGLEKINVGGQLQEAIRLVYKDNDVLYVSINSLHKVTKYVGKDGKPPKINKIGSDAWEATKRKAKREIKLIATDLIKLYAKRKAASGFAYSPDTYLQTELEASFIYEDTPDQLRATQDVKRDMEAFYPMDRLICGDVGFGKTEVALRAAAKAIADNKQVAILVPTTILALQHYKTFSDRLKDFPCKVDYVNRFKTAKEKRQTLEALADGKVDIIIGTHALLGKNVKFKELGLLIIDEEQKFGVAAKEKLREAKVNIDTLTLTATPIPRTLQFSLLSARDLSIMSTPPPNRQPIHTEIIKMDEHEKIRDAIQYEVYRGGQVFFVHNRVSDLPQITTMIRKLCPDIDVGMAHGQMGNDELEKCMLGFIDGKYDVLVSTNIVETGLDVANANTIFIHNAHQFGLSDLHQLRGRVGRSNRKAFCYLVTLPIHVLPDDSRKRLRSIEEFSELGSGFQIAMRDLDIRGAGDLLGGEQSGFISDIGFDMYQKILNEAIAELKSSDFKDLFDEEIKKEQKFVSECSIETDLEMLIPDHYINSTAERFSLYNRLDNIENEENLQKFQNELSDRFGKIPHQVKELFNAVRLRWVAKQLGFERIILKNRKLRCYFVENQDSPYYQSSIFQAILSFAQAQPKIMHFKQTDKNFMLIRENVKSITEARDCLAEIKQG